MSILVVVNIDKHACTSVELTWFVYQRAWLSRVPLMNSLNWASRRVHDWFTGYTSTASGMSKVLAPQLQMLMLTEILFNGSG